MSKIIQSYDNVSGIAKVGDRKRAGIIKSAATVFSHKGYDGARVDEIARLAGMSKNNMLYYFKSKKILYRVVVEEVLNLWLELIGDIDEFNDPVAVMSSYINDKMNLSRIYPEASRIFAMELLAGAPVIGDYLANQLRHWVNSKSHIFLQWQSEGRMAPVPPEHVFFIIWAVTQTYADFKSQITAVLNVEDYDSELYREASQAVLDVMIRGLGLRREPVFQ
jgi:TetR/AcrR family transcriptional regulator